jgi:hypothetical protein
MPAQTRKTIQELDLDAEWDNISEQDADVEVLLEQLLP